MGRRVAGRMDDSSTDDSAGFAHSFFLFFFFLFFFFSFFFSFNFFFSWLGRFGSLAGIFYRSKSRGRDRRPR
jgi:hypothetical protein